MGQAAGVKRRKRRAGNFNILKNCKSQHRRQQNVYKAGLEFLGLKDGVGGKCLMTRISEGGLVANLKHFNKPDPLMLVRQAKAAMEKKTAPIKGKVAGPLVGNVEDRRKSSKQKVMERRTINIPKSQAKFISYFVDRYGQDYKEMVTDPMNFDQFTWKQFRTQVTSFKNSVQYVEYLKDRGLMPQAPTVISKDSNEETHSTDESEDDADTPEDKMLAKIAELENEEKILKKKMTGRVRKTKTSRDEVLSTNAGEDSTDDQMEQETSSTIVIKKTQQNVKRRARAKKFKVAKQKRLQKETRKLGL